MEQLKPGTKLNNRYRIIRFLGQGGFAFTYEAVQESLNLKVCIKEMHVWGEAKGSEEAAGHKTDFINEGQVLGSIKCDSVVKVLDYFEENDTCYIVLEYLEGMTLKEYVQKKGSVEPACLFRSIKNLLKGLSTLHSMGLIHRDIAPDNIMVTKEKEDSLDLVLFDFGTVRQSDRSEYTCTLKDGYSPIEQAAGGEKQGAYTDIYALCATLWYCLTGEKPPAAYARLLDDDLKRPSELGIKIDKGSEDVLMKGLSVSPDDRYQTAEEMLSDIEAVSGEADAKTGNADEDIAGKTDKGKKSKKRLIAVIASVVAVVVALTGIFVKKMVGGKDYYPETMYRVTLTPDDEFTVAGYNRSIKTLRERLDIFSKNSGSYELSENEGIITLLLNKEDFAENEIDSENYKTTTVETASIPEYVIRAYISRAAVYSLKSTDTGEMIDIDQTTDISVIKKEGAIPGIDKSKYGITKDEYSYFEIGFTDEFFEKNKDVFEGWDNKYILCQDVDCTPYLELFKTIPMDDKKGFYIIDEDDGIYTELLEYNLTHEPLEHYFNIGMDEQVSWQDDESQFGEYQTEEIADNEEKTDIYVYGLLSDGEKADSFYVLRKRLDALKSPYALGSMDSLTAVMPGCDGPVYSFLALSSCGSVMRYADILALLTYGSDFYICTDDGEQVPLYGTGVEIDGSDSLVVSNAEIAEGLTDSGKTVYLKYSDACGNNEVTLMKMDKANNGSLVFSEFANGESISEDNKWAAALIEACIKNKLPVALNKYDVKTGDGSELEELGLFS